MGMYIKEWDRKVEVLGNKDSFIITIKNEIERIEGLSRKEFGIIFGKKTKDRKHTKGRWKSFRHSQFKGGFPKENKSVKDKHKHIVDNKLYVVKPPLEGE